MRLVAARNLRQCLLSNSFKARQSRQCQRFAATAYPLVESFNGKKNKKFKLFNKKNVVSMSVILFEMLNVCLSFLNIFSIYTSLIR